MNMLRLFADNLMGISLIRQDVFRAKDFYFLMDFLKPKEFLPEVYEIFWESMKCHCVSCFLGRNIRVFQVFPFLLVLLQARKHGLCQQNLNSLFAK